MTFCQCSARGAVSLMIVGLLVGAGEAQKEDRGRGSERSTSRGQGAAASRSSDSKDSPRSSGATKSDNAQRGQVKSSQQRQSFFRGSTDRDSDRESGVREFNRDRDRDRDRDGRLRDRRDGDADRGLREFDRDGQRRENGGRLPSILDNRSRGDRDWDEDDHQRWNRTADRVRDDWKRRDRDDLPFRSGWWNNYPRDRWPVFAPWSRSEWRDRPYYWWGWTPENRLVSWFAFDWSRPRYWSYGPGANIYYQDNHVYYDGDAYLPVNDYYERIYALAHSVPEIDESAAEAMDWAPLGVFAVFREGANDEDAQRTLQLAVNREGVLTGTYYNAQNGHVHPVTGKVDDRNQRAAWAFADGEHPRVVFETSIFNLTRSDATMMVHFGPKSSDSEVWRLVRLEQPTGSATQSSQLPSPNRLP